MIQNEPSVRGAEPAFSTYLAMKSSVKGIPLSGHFELTTRCNFNCKMCYVHDNDNKQELTAAEWIEIGRQAAERGMVFLLLTGGEPLLRKDFKEIYSGLKSLGLLISINTNGSLIDEDMLDFLAKDPPVRINVSLYGASNETYSNLCGNCMFETVRENIRRLREKGLQVKINCSVTPYNVCDVRQMYRIAEELNVQIQTTSYMFPPVRINDCQYGEAPHRFTAEEAAAAQLLCQEQYLTPEQLAESYNPDPVPEMECTGTEAHMHCRAGKTAFWMTWDGRMLPCGMLPFEGVKVSEVGFDNAWEATRKYVQTVLEPPECAACPKKKQCPACVASCVAESGDSRIRPAYICTMTQQLDALKKAKYLGE